MIEIKEGENWGILYLTEKMTRLDSLTPTGRGDLLASSTHSFVVLYTTNTCTDVFSKTHKIL